MGKRALTTDDIFEKIQAGESICAEEIDFVSPEDLRHALYNEFQKHGYSSNQIATECGISPSQLSDFLNSKKQMSRDKLLSIFITLEFDIEKVQKSLLHFGASELYARNARDFIILKGIKEALSLDDINENLRKEHFDTLC